MVPHRLRDTLNRKFSIIFEERRHPTKVKYLFNTERVWPKVSPEARDLLNKLLQRNPAKRISPAQALEHKWIADCGSLVPIDQTVLSNLERFYVLVMPFSSEISS